MKTFTLFVAVVLFASTFELRANVAQASLPASTPIPEIGHVRATFTCSILVKTIGQAIGGLRANDALLDSAQGLQGNILRDAAGDAAAHRDRSESGAGSASQLDDLQLGSLLNTMAKNLKRIEGLLDDPNGIPATATSEQERKLQASKAKLQAVIAGQRASMNILYTVVESNQSNDLQSRQNPMASMLGDQSAAQVAAAKIASNPIRLTGSEPLNAARRFTKQAEREVVAAVVPIAESCSR